MTFFDQGTNCTDTTPYSTCIYAHGTFRTYVANLLSREKVKGKSTNISCTSDIFYSAIRALKYSLSPGYLTLSFFNSDCSYWPDQSKKMQLLYINHFFKKKVLSSPIKGLEKILVGLAIMDLSALVLSVAVSLY